MRSISLAIVLVIAASGIAQTYPSSFSAGPATGPAVPREFSALDIPALLRSFDEVFKDEIELVGYSFARNAITMDESKAPYWLVLHLRPRREGFHVVRCDTRHVGGDEVSICEFYFTIGKANTGRLCAGGYEQKFTPLANVGDTVLLPIPGAANTMKFSKVPFVTKAADGGDTRMADVVAASQRKSIAALDEIEKSFPAGPDLKITNRAHPNLIVRGAAVESMAHRIMGRATDTCTLLLEAKETGAFELEISAAVAAAPAGRPRPAPDPLPLTIVRADQPVSVLLAGYSHWRVSDSGHRSSSSGEFRPFPKSPDLPTTMLRVGDLLSVRGWEAVVQFDEGAPRKITPPPITLEQRPLTPATNAVGR